MPSASALPSAPGHAGTPGGPHGPARWTLRLLGGFELSDGEQRFTRLASRPMVALLARLALWPTRNHPREELVELLWPGVDPQVSRNRLRQTLSVLKSVLEPPRAVPAPVLQADRHDVRLLPGVIDCDVPAFEREVRQGNAAAALALYRGELLPGYFDEWVLDERMRLEAVSERMAQRMAAQAGTEAGTHGTTAAMPGRASADVAASPPRPDGFSPATADATAGVARSAAGQRAALPVYLTRHFLPEPLRAQWLAELAQHRLVTLLGPGGAGKTRLAIELARALQAAMPHAAAPGRRESADDAPPTPLFDTIAFVSLVACETRAQALDALAAAVGVTGRGGEVVDELVLALHERRLLLVLDNFEQLVASAGDVVARLAGALPQLRLLITSRRALGVDGERALSVPALALPQPDGSLAQTLANPAVALFVDRARQVRTDFHLGEHNRAAVQALVRALEGLPLAIELAASRVRSLAPARILELLGAGDAGAPRLELLARSGPRGALDARHASMDRVIRWSWQQLSAEEAGLMQALTVFSGGCTAAAAAAVRGLAPLPTALLLDSLVAGSLLRATETPWGDMRFDMYEPIREFALVELRQSGPAGAEAGLRAAHRAWLLEWAESLPTTPSLPAMRAELPNLSTALHGALSDGDSASAVRTMLALGIAHDDMVLGPDSLAYLQQAVARCDDAEQRSRGHTQLAQLLFTAGRGDEARRHAELGLEQVPDEPGHRARAMHVKARLHWLMSGHAAWLDPLIDEAETLARAALHTQVLARLTVLRAAIAYAHRKDMVQGESLYRAALAMWERLGNQHAINGGRYFVALMVHEAGRHEEGIAGADEVVQSARRLADTRRVSQALQVRGKAQAALRRWHDAAASLRESIRLAWDAMAPVELTRSMRDLSPVLAHLRQGETAVRLQAYSAAAARHHVGQADGYDMRQEKRVRRLVGGEITAARWLSLRREGAGLGPSDAVALALHDDLGSAGAALSGADAPGQI